MPLVKKSVCFEGYPLTAIPQSLVEHLRQVSDSRWQPNAMLLRLQCFCEITKQTLIGQDNAKMLLIFNDFSAAMFSSLFREPNSRNRPFLTLKQLSLRLQDGFKLTYPSTLNRENWSTEFKQRVLHFEHLEVSQQCQEFWTGWSAKNAAGRQHFLKLWHFWNRFGPERTRELVQACNAWFAKGHAGSIQVVEQFADYLVELDEIAFDDSMSIGLAVSSFFPIYFRSELLKGVRLSTLTMQWRRFANLLSNHLLGYSWASPIPAIPSPRTKTMSGEMTHVRADNNGKSVKHVLITPVPLQFSDSQAMDLLFRDIRGEVDAVRLWARCEVECAQQRTVMRKTLARIGIVSQTSSVGIGTGLRFRTSRECPTYLSNAAATFEAHGFRHLLSEQPPSLIYPNPLAQTAWELGLPTPTLLLAHASILVIEHPAITTAFLDNLELFDVDGQQCGLVQTDAGWYLRGVKRRRGAALAQQEVLLNTESLQVVRNIVEMTEPLRQWLRAQKSPHWRKLFLVVASMGVHPNRWNSAAEACRHSDWLAERFKDLGGLSAIAADDLAKRFSLRRLRSSAGLLVYLETGSVEQMAKALGHKKWRSNLLDSYLPRPIQVFFAERWIRLFQTGIICEALKDSSFLLEACNFSSMDELDQFLEYHALRRIPAHLQNPDQISECKTVGEQSAQVVFGVGIGILAILISIESAVRVAQRQPCGRALRWAKISERLIPHLETQTEQPELRAMVAAARRRADPQRVVVLIYG